MILKSNILKIGMLSAAVLLSMNSCQKNYNAFPADPVKNPSMNLMRGTFTCDVNGSPFVGEIKQVVENPDLGTYTVTAIEYDPSRIPENYRSVSLTINGVDGYQDKNFQIGTVASASYAIARKDASTRIYATIFNNENSFWKVDNVRDPAKGEFSFNAATVIFGADSVWITNGKYDFPTQ